MATENVITPETPTPVSMDHIALQIKSLEQRTTSVSLPRTASVLELKQEIQIAFDVESNRQRLIFQGRVLKDDKNLTDYANLDNGKVIHLVIRPIDAPHNPLNDDPSPGNNIRHIFNRGTNRSRTFPHLGGRFPMMEGYAFITLDSNLGDLGADNRSFLSSVMNTISGGVNNRNRTANSTEQNGRSPSTTTTNTPPSATNNNNNSNTARTSSFSFGRGPSEFVSPLASSPVSDRAASSLFPPSVEVRLARTLGSMRNVRAMLQDNADNNLTPNSTSEQLQEIRNRLRTSGNNQSAQIGMVLNELADLMTEAAPRIRQVATDLRQENQSIEEERNNSRSVLDMSRIVQGMSLINHFLGSVLSSAEIDSLPTRRSTTRHVVNLNTTDSSNATTPPTSTAQRQQPFLWDLNFPTATNNRPTTTTDLPPFLTANNNNTSRGNTEAIRTTTPPTVSNQNRSTLSSSSSPASTSSSSTTRGIKRRMDQLDVESSSSSSTTKKGKETDKKD